MTATPTGTHGLIANFIAEKVTPNRVSAGLHPTLLTPPGMRVRNIWTKLKYPAPNISGGALPHPLVHHRMWPMKGIFLQLR